MSEETDTLDITMPVQTGDEVEIRHLMWTLVYLGGQLDKRSHRIMKIARGGINEDSLVEMALENVKLMDMRDCMTKITDRVDTILADKMYKKEAS